MMVMESGFSSPRRETFPAGLRVLVVDDDPTWLKILEKMLKKCSYDVTTCGLAREALKLLRDRKDGFDIVISDVNMPDMDGFKLLEHVGLEMDLPVIMMSVDGETSRVMKGVQHGACDYLLKPIRMKELKNIWQHVVRKRMLEVRDIECLEDRNGDHSNDGHYGGDHTLLKKRKDVDNQHDEKDSSDPSSTKKARVVWTVELHQKFVKAVNQIGIDSDKVGPKKILDLMKVPWLTRENVASHLQKYRLYLSRIRKEDRTGSSCGGMKNLDYSPKESSGSTSLQNSTFQQPNDVSTNHEYSGNHLPVQTIDSKPLETDPKNSNFLPLTEHRKSFNSENTYPQKRINPQAGLSHTFRSPDTSMNYGSFDSPVSGRYPWSEEVPEMQFEPEYEPHPKLEECFNQPTAPIVQQHIQADLPDPAPPINLGPSISKNDTFALMDLKPSNLKRGSNDIKQLSPIERVLESFSMSNPDAFGCVFDMKHPNSSQGDNGNKEQALLGRSIQSFPLEPKTHVLNPQGLEPNFGMTFDMKNQSCSQASAVSLGSEQRNQVLGNESAFELLGEDLMCRWLQTGEAPSIDFGLDYVGFSDFNFPGQFSEVNAPKFGLDNEYLFEWTEHPLIDQGLLFS